MAEEKPPQWFQNWKDKEALVSKIIELEDKLFAFYGVFHPKDPETRKKDLMKLDIKFLEFYRDQWWDDLQKITAGQPTLRTIKILKERIGQLDRWIKADVALKEHYQSTLAGLQDFKCEICGRAISWLRGRPPKYCKQCGPIVKKVRAIKWATTEKGRESMRKAAREAMRKRRAHEKALR